MKRIASSVALNGRLAVDILAAVSDTILILDPMGRLLFVSNASGEVLGNDPEHWIGRSALDLVHPDDMAIVVSRLKSARETPDASRAFVNIRISTNGRRWLPAEAHAFNPVDFDGTPGVLVSIRDTSGRLDFERARKLAASTMVADPDAAVDNRDIVIQKMLPSMFTDTGTQRQLMLVNVSMRNFDQLIDSFGVARAHGAMLALADVLNKVSRTDDLVALVTSRELLIACPDVSTAIQADMITHRLFDACSASELVPAGYGLRAGCALTSSGDELADVLDFVASADHFAASCSIQVHSMTTRPSRTA